MAVIPVAEIKEDALKEPPLPEAKVERDTPVAAPAAARRGASVNPFD
jgi:hypothetical protein